MMYLKIFLELNPQIDNTSAETTFIEQDNGVHVIKQIKNHGKTSSHSKTGISKKIYGANKFIIYVLQESLYMSLLSCLCFW